MPRAGTCDNNGRFDPLSGWFILLQDLAKQATPIVGGGETRRQPVMKMGGSCAVVGSSGSLRGARLGRAIDAHDVVIRFNYAPTRGYEDDVGTKTDVRVCFKYEV